MFDKTIIETPRNVNHNHKSEINHNYATSPEQVRNVTELKKDILDSIYSKMTLTNNHFSIQVLELVDKADWFGKRAIIITKLGGKQVTLEHDFSKGDSVESILDTFYEYIAKELVKEFGYKFRSELVNNK